MFTARMRGSSLLVLVAAVAGLAGCDNQPAPLALPPPGDLPEIALDTPEDAARSVLLCLQTELRAIAHDDQDMVEACREKLVKLAAAKTIEETFARLPQFKVVVGNDLIDGCITNWGATIAYYAEGLHLGRIRRGSQSPARVAVIVPASGPGDDALIQVTCVRGDDELWRVSQIEFVVEKPAGSPASRPAFQPASQPSG